MVNVHILNHLSDGQLLINQWAVVSGSRTVGFQWFWGLFCVEITCSP